MTSTPIKLPHFDGAPLLLSPPALRLLELNQRYREGTISPAEREVRKLQILDAAQELHQQQLQRRRCAQDVFNSTSPKAARVQQIFSQYDQPRETAVRLHARGASPSESDSDSDASGSDGSAVGVDADVFFANGGDDDHDCALNTMVGRSPGPDGFSAGSELLDDLEENSCGTGEDDAEVEGGVEQELDAGDGDDYGFGEGTIRASIVGGVLRQARIDANAAEEPFGVDAADLQQQQFVEQDQVAVPQTAEDECMDPAVNSPFASPIPCTLVGGVLRQARVDMNDLQLDLGAVQGAADDGGQCGQAGVDIMDSYDAKYDRTQPPAQSRAMSRGTQDLFAKLNACQILRKPLSSFDNMAGEAKSSVDTSTEGGSVVEAQQLPHFCEAGGHVVNQNQLAVRLPPLQAYRRSRSAASPCGSTASTRTPLSPLAISCASEEDKYYSKSEDGDESSSEGDSSSSNGSSDDEDARGVLVSNLMHSSGTRHRRQSNCTDDSSGSDESSCDGDSAGNANSEGGRQHFVDDTTKVTFVVDGTGVATAVGASLSTAEALQQAHAGSDANALDLVLEPRAHFSPAKVAPVSVSVPAAATAMLADAGTMLADACAKADDIQLDEARSADQSSDSEECVGVDKENCPPPRALVPRAPPPKPQQSTDAQHTDAAGVASGRRAGIAFSRGRRQGSAPPRRRATAVPSMPMRPQAPKAPSAPNRTKGARPRLGRIAGRRQLPHVAAERDRKSEGAAVRVVDQFGKWYSAVVVGGNQESGYELEYTGVWQGHRENKVAKARIRWGDTRDDESETVGTVDAVQAQQEDESSSEDEGQGQVDKKAGDAADQVLRRLQQQLHVCNVHSADAGAHGDETGQPLPKGCEWAQDFAKSLRVVHAEESDEPIETAQPRPEMMATGALEPKLAEQWRCPVCTFANSTMFDEVCTMCFYPRDGDSDGGSGDKRINADSEQDSVSSDADAKAENESKALQ